MRADFNAPTQPPRIIPTHEQALDSRCPRRLQLAHDLCHRDATRAGIEQLQRLEYRADRAVPEVGGDMVLTPLGLRGFKVSTLRPSAPSRLRK